jgi:hypothetical protein
MYYGFEYFCGANVSVKIEDFAILEVAGIAVDLQESVRPIYGYSSRHFDAVGRGQVLARGQLLINYVHQDYLFEAIAMALENKGLRSPPQQVGTQGLRKTMDTQTARENVQYMLDMGEYDLSRAENLKQAGYADTGQEANAEVFATHNPNDIVGGLDIKIIFGQQGATRYHGKTGMLLRAVHFLGRGQSVQISEETIVEVYPFIARNVMSLRSIKKQELIEIDNSFYTPEEAAEEYGGVPETATRTIN